MSRCYSCFKEFDDQFDICPFCGEIKSNEPKEPIHLRPGTVLLDRYVIGTTVGAGGFGIIYKAWDSKLETIVAVKEFFASRLVTRAAGELDVIVNKKSQEEFTYRKERFLAEARTMAKFGAHRSIPNVFEFFEENGTAYIVMELLHGQALNDYLHQCGGKVDQEFVLLVANEIGNALISLHQQGIIHRDVAPDNVYICSDKDIRLKLLDLGAAKLADSTDEVIDIILKPGYSPVEQYDNTKGIGPWTDIYALGATLYVMLTGIKPDESTNRKINDTVLSPHEIDESIPENLSNAIMKAMAVEKHMRFKTVAEFLKAINGEKKVVTLAKERKRRKRRRFTGILVACLVLAIIGTSVFNTYDKKKSEQVLKKATISVWFSVAEETGNENSAMTSIAEQFMSTFPNVTVELKAIPDSDYEKELLSASETGSLPTLFESTQISDSILDNAQDISKILDSDQAGNCLFLNQYNKYYSTKKKIPLAIEVPMAFVITSGVTSIDYKDKFFTKLSDFSADGLIASDADHNELLSKNINVSGLKSKEDFLNFESGNCAVLLSSSTEIRKIQKAAQGYNLSYVYYKSKDIQCKFTNEFSIGSGNANEIKAAERLLTWMLGNVYQNTLMVSRGVDSKNGLCGWEIPINKECFEEKTSQKYYATIKDIYKDFSFKK